ncbi:hypothetical protein SAMN05660420_00325 [Desulfuromusa kysingii]|uniref:Late embryogenesis abundant protein n=1 Tax=Desulfuromusa kysingii TaxID=37625 RepID=A0A1H3VWE5_9BACT|nr:hypothetical protein [Desulfuromusa kysingii]SDZ79116.1 hypothetical protein SAMN05660420_00325 [Desulfuromusa kysingii]
MKKLLFIVLTVCVGLIFSGCQTTTSYYLGAKADAEGVVSLVTVPEGTQQWQDLNVTVDYDLNRNGDNLGIKGSLTFSNSPQMNFTAVRDLKLKLFLLDQDMRVVDYFDIARTLGHDLEGQTPFSQEVQLKAGVVAMTFGYEGFFVDSDSEGSSSETVWKLPKRSE